MNDDEAKQTPKQSNSVSPSKKGKSPNNEANKENKPAGVVDAAEKKRLEELKKQNEEILNQKDQ